MESRLSIALILALALCLTVAEKAESGTKTKDAVGKGYGAPYGGGSDNSYGQGNEYGKPNYNNNKNYGSQPPYGGSSPYGGPPPSYGQPAYGNNNNNYGNQNNGYNNGGYGHNDYNAPQAYDNYGHGPSGYGNNYDNSYPEPGPFYFHNKHHYYDTHYCSVHGSFSLAYTKEDSYGEDKGYNSKPEKNAYGSENQPAYGNSNSYGDNNNYGSDYQNKQIKHKTRFYTRQYCRYAAAASDKACHFCCRVVARSSNTSPDDIVSAIFAFDPISPTKNGAGFGVSEYSSEKPSGKEYGGRSSSIFQCVCCAPKHNNY